MMFTKLFSLAALFTAYASAAATNTVTLSYDPAYDNAGQSLSTVACSDGPNGLLTKHFTTFGSLPGFPSIGGASAIAGWNSPSCGTCWKLTYNGKSINVLAIDHAGAGFNIGLQAMNKLTNNQAQFLGRVNVAAEQVAASDCGLH